MVAIYNNIILYDMVTTQNMQKYLVQLNFDCSTEKVITKLSSFIH